MRVRLPLTLAIMDGMSVGVGDEVYILPLSSVVESFQVAARDDQAPSAAPAASSRCATSTCRCSTLEQVFDVPRFDFEHGSDIMVVVEAEGGRVALLVDELLGQQQVVVKNLEANYRKRRRRLGRHDHGRRPRRADPRRGRAGPPVAPLTDRGPRRRKSPPEADSSSTP